MPSLEMYKKILHGTTAGEIHKHESDMIMEETWDNDMSAQTAYFYDYYHDSDITRLNDMQPENDSNKIPIRVKYLKHTSQTLSKDNVSFHLQLKPSQNLSVVPYYKSMFEDRYGAFFPVGLYVDIKDNRGIYNRWLVVARANYNDPQFSTFEILRCDYVFQWIVDGIKMQMAGALRSQSSYNSGVWVDYKIESPTDQQQMILSLNRDTEKLFYNQRLIIDNKVLSEPRTWRITKVNRIQNNGVTLITCAQSMFDEHLDYIEKDENGKIIGMWANYYCNGILPEEKIVTDGIIATITVNGNRVLRVGGSRKKLNVTFSKDDVVLDYIQGTWSFKINGEDASSYVETSLDDVEENQIGVRYIGDDSHVGEILDVYFITDDESITATFKMSIENR